MTNITTESYWRKTGYKFYPIGDEEKFKEIYTECNNSMSFSDEEGWFNSFLCLIDCKECDKMCSEHRPPINPLIEEFYKNCCNFERVK